MSDGLSTLSTESLTAAVTSLLHKPLPDINIHTVNAQCVSIPAPVVPVTGGDDGPNTPQQYGSSHQASMQPQYESDVSVATSTSLSTIGFLLNKPSESHSNTGINERILENTSSNKRLKFSVDNLHLAGSSFDTTTSQMPGASGNSPSALDSISTFSTLQSISTLLNSYPASYFQNPAVSGRSVPDCVRNQQNVSLPPIQGLPTNPLQFQQLIQSLFQQSDLSIQSQLPNLPLQTSTAVSLDSGMIVTSNAAQQNLVSFPTIPPQRLLQHSASGGDEPQVMGATKLSTDHQTQPSSQQPPPVLQQALTPGDDNDNKVGPLQQFPFLVQPSPQGGPLQLIPIGASLDLPLLHMLQKYQVAKTTAEISPSKEATPISSAPATIQPRPPALSLQTLLNQISQLPGARPTPTSDINLIQYLNSQLLNKSSDMRPPQPFLPQFLASDSIPALCSPAQASDTTCNVNLPGLAALQSCPIPPMFPDTTSTAPQYTTTTLLSDTTATAHSLASPASQTESAHSVDISRSTQPYPTASLLSNVTATSHAIASSPAHHVPPNDMSTAQPYPAAPVLSDVAATGHSTASSASLPCILPGSAHSLDTSPAQSYSAVSQDNHGNQEDSHMESEEKKTAATSYHDNTVAIATADLSNGRINIFCTICNMLYPEGCEVHSTEYVYIQDEPILPLARASLPKTFCLQQTSTSDFKDFLGVWCKEYISERTLFGPVVGERKKMPASDYKQQTDGFNPYRLYLTEDDCDALCLCDETVCNWMMFVRAAHSLMEQNCTMYRDADSFYLITTTEVKEEEELLMWFSADLCQQLGLSQDPENTKFLQCKLCGKYFTSKKLHTGHMRAAHPDHYMPAWTCPMCGKTFSSGSKLNSHMMLHMGLKPFTCTYCSKQFSDHSNLKTHILIHTGQKKYKCETCSKTFRQKAHLDAHLIVHTGTKKFKCSYCDQHFARQADLKTHTYRHTQELSYTCGTCGKKFYKTQNYKKHLKVHTGERNYMCNKCFKGFQTKYHRDRHLSICKEKNGKESSYMSLEEVAELGNTYEIALKNVTIRREGSTAEQASVDNAGDS